MQTTSAYMHTHLHAIDAFDHNEDFSPGLVRARLALGDRLAHRLLERLGVCVYGGGVSKGKY